MFKKKKQDDEWYIGEYALDEPTETTSKKSKKKTPKQKKKKGRGNPEDMTEEIFEESPYDAGLAEFDLANRRPNSLRRRETDAYTTDSFDDYVVEEDGLPPIPKWKIIVPLVCLCIFSVGVLGYFNTDFDSNNNAYYVPLQQKYERKYVAEADEVLQIILDMNETLDMDTALLPTEYMERSTRISAQHDLLKAKTTELSKYVGVPNELVNYHNQLITFSLSTQTFLEKLIKNYNDVNYNAFREAGLTDYYNSLRNIKEVRASIDNILFSNMGGE